MNKEVRVLDSNGQPIVCRSIVGMKKNCPWYKFQGLVVAPYSEIEGNGYTVAVFFGREVAPSQFNFPWLDVEKWDKQYAKDLAVDDGSFLLKDDLWKTCPRVVFFQPRELLVRDSWSIVTLAERLFPGFHHSVFGWPKGIIRTSSIYRCFLKDCQLVATRVALFNVWGSVCPIHVCDECFSKTNGCCGDSLPEMKNPFLLANGQPVII